jgi:hypothetical protein
VGEKKKKKKRGHVISSRRRKRERERDVATQRQPHKVPSTRQNVFQRKKKAKEKIREEQIIAGKEYRLLADQYFLLATETVAGEQVGISMNAFNAECDRAGRQAGMQ